MAPLSSEAGAFARAMHLSGVPARSYGGTGARFWPAGIACPASPGRAPGRASYLSSAHSRYTDPATAPEAGSTSASPAMQTCWQPRPAVRPSGAFCAQKLSSGSVIGQRMTASFAIELHDSLMDRSLEVFGSREGRVSKMMTLQVAPEFFDVLELRSVF